MLFYTFEKRSEGGYPVTYIRVFVSQARSFKELVEGTVDNKDGYGSLDVARDLHKRFENAIERGWTHAVDHYHSKYWVTFRWQHYKAGEKPQQYCEVDIDIGNKYNELQDNLKFMQKIVKKLLYLRGHAFVHYRSIEPLWVMKTLKGMKGKYVTLVRLGHYDRRYCYTTRKTRPMKEAA